MGLSARAMRIHPVQWFCFWTGAAVSGLSWLTLRVWRWELTLEWRP